MRSRRVAVLSCVAVLAATMGEASAQQPASQPPPPAPTPGAPAYDPSLQAGGLAPPPPMTTPGAPPPTTGQTEQQLDRAKEEDAGRGLNWIYVDLEGGFQHVGLKTFSVDEESLTAGFVPTTSSGGVIGAGLGLQLLFLTIGPRARFGFFSDWQLFSVGGELGFRVPIGVVEPHFGIGAGYTALGSLTELDDAIAIRGFYGRLGGGLDVFVSPVFSLGANLSWELLGLTRPELSADEVERVRNDNAAQDPGGARAQLLAVEGTSYGSALTITAVAGLHF